MKNWFSDLLNGILQNILANVLIAIAIPVVGVIYAFTMKNLHGQKFKITLFDSLVGWQRVELTNIYDRD